MGQLVTVYVEVGERAKALQMFSEIRKQVPKDSPELAQRLASLGLSLLEAKAFTDAEPLLRECLALREKQQPDDWRTSNTRSMLGGSLLGQKKYAEAESLLLKGYEGMKQREKTIPKGGETRIPEALDRLIELYTATNKSDEAKKWRAERAKYQASKAPPPPEKK